MTDAPPRALDYLDANVFIDFVEGAPEFAEPVKDLFISTRGREGIFATSALTLAEVLAPAGHALGPRLSPEQRRIYLSLIVDNPAVLLIPVSRSLLIETAEMRASARYKLPDAIHVVTALNQNCRFMISRDAHMSQLPDGKISRFDPGPSVAKLLNEAFDGQ